MQEAAVLLTEEQIRQKVAELAGQIEASNGGRTLEVVGILDNGIMFMCDLVRQLRCPVACKFIRMEMVDQIEGGVERRNIVYRPNLEVAGKDILLVDAVLQSGVTIDHLIHQMLVKKARSVRTVVLIDRPEDRRVDMKPDFWGFQVAGRFLVGYGMGYQDLYRNLPYVGEIHPEKS